MTDKTQAALKLALIQEAEIQMKDHPSKDARWFAKSVYEYLMAEQPAQQQEPFGYFKAEPFGWTDCAETDEGAIALYERPQPAQQQEPWPEEPAGHMAGGVRPASKPWVGLTDAEVKHQWEIWRANIPRYAGFAKGIEAKLKEKNA